MPEHARRGSHTDSCANAQQMGYRRGPGHTQVNGQRDTPGPYAVDPALQHIDVEAHLADEVGRVSLFIGHGPDYRVVVDFGMRFRVAGDPDGEIVAEPLHRVEQIAGTGEVAHRSGRIAG